jgi:hypothetical protein
VNRIDAVQCGGIVPGKRTFWGKNRRSTDCRQGNTMTAAESVSSSRPAKETRKSQISFNGDGPPGYDRIMEAVIDKTKTSLAIDKGYVFKMFPSAVA